jgi:murein DD-endopeptidase MepM/ murein hydrolase activator NlpD
MKNKNILLIIIIIIVFLTTGIAIYFRLKKSSISLTSSPSSSNSNISTSPTPTPTPTTNIDSKYDLANPLPNFRSRVWLNGFGNQPLRTISRDQYSDYICPGQTMKAGYHTAADAEVTQEEINQDVPVYAIADGVVREAKEVSGYGSVIIIQFNVAGNDYAALYGHINIATFTVSVGDSVTKGQKLALLGSQCSAENGNVRKHLHFGVHKGSGIDIRGYVPDTTTLSKWLDPLQLYS